MDKKSPIKFTTDTIAAISTPSGKGGIGIIRISGPDAFHIIEEIFRTKSGKRFKEKFESHKLIFGKIVNSNHEYIDEVMVCKMVGPKSYTREHTAEIHAHSGRANMELILDLVLSEGARIAEPGEFTKRAFLNGRIDLIQAEAIGNIIDAKTASEREYASHMLFGTFREQIQNFIKKINSIIATMEAGIEFQEIECEALDSPTFYKNIEAVNILYHEISKLIRQGESTIRTTPGIKIAIVGKVNVGKSSLFNQILGVNRAIVSDIAGTTRDVIEGNTRIGDHGITFFDIAGFRSTEDPLENLGISKAREVIEKADIFLVVYDNDYGFIENIFLEKETFKNKKFIIVQNKNDLHNGQDNISIPLYLKSYPIVSLSSLNGKGIEKLFKEIEKACKSIGYNHKNPISCNIRQLNSLKLARAKFNQCLKIEFHRNPELIILSLREAKIELEFLTGSSYNEDILDQIFSQFCVGK